MRALIAAICACTFASLNPAWAESLIGDAKVPYSADRTVVWKDKSYTGRVYSAPGMQRHEQTISGFRVVAILRADRQMAYLMLPDMHLFTKAPFPGAVTEKGGTDRLGPPVDKGIIAGQRTQAYHLQSRGNDGSSLDGVVWLTEAGVPMKIDGIYGDPGLPPHHGTLELSNLVKAPQDPALFEVPRGMNEVPEQAVDGLLTMRMPKLK